MGYKVNIGDSAPEFKAKDQHGETISSSDWKGKYVILYFYPKDNTPGCTSEACSFRDNMARLDNKGAIVVGVSPDSSASHDQFINQYQLNFSLLPDENKDLSRKFDVLRAKDEEGKISEKLERTTFVIGPQGKIVWLERPVQVDGHVDRVIQALEKLKS